MTAVASRLNQQISELASLGLVRRAGPAGPDGTVVWTAATQLTLAGLTHAPRNFEFLEVIEHTAAGADIRYQSLEHPMTYVAATGVLTVTGATFLNASTFTVIYAAVTDPNAPAVVPIVIGLIALLGQPGTLHSPDDFAAAFASATTLTLTGIPVVPANVQFAGVIEYNVGALREVYMPETNVFAYNAATGVLTVTGASFLNTSEFMVVIVSQEKAYDPVLNALQVAKMNAEQWDFVDSITPINAVNLAVTAPADSGWINVKGETFVRLFYSWTSGSGVGVHNLLVTMVGESTDAGTTEFIELAGPAGTMTAGPTTAVLISELVQVTGYNRIKIYADESGGTGKGTVTVRVTMMNR